MFNKGGLVSMLITCLKFMLGEEATNQLISGLDTALKFTVQVKIKWPRKRPGTGLVIRSAMALIQI